MGIIAGGCFTQMVMAGMGRHLSCVHPEQITSVLKWSAISEPLNVISIGLVKISVCLCILRVVDRARRRIALFLWFLLVFVTITHLGLALVFFLHCSRPLAALWDPQVSGKCLTTAITVLAAYFLFGKTLKDNDLDELMLY